MLLIQNIRLSWDKNERGAKGEDVRRSFPPALICPRHAKSIQSCKLAIYIIRLGLKKNIIREFIFC